MALPHGRMLASVGAGQGFALAPADPARDRPLQVVLLPARRGRARVRQTQDTGGDAEVAALNQEFADRWHVTRHRCGDLDAAREPDRAYHVLEAHPAAMRATLARVERNGGRLVQ